MSLPLYDSGVTSGLLSGLLFGYVLESAGLGSPRKLTAQFRFTDWTVFKVMFTAIVVAALGLYISDVTGFLRPNGVYIPTTFYWAMLGGGMLLGAGMAIGGYCPGTSVVGLFSGRADGVFFMLGMIFGSAVFASSFDGLSGFYYAAKGPQAQTLDQLLHIPAWLVIVLLVVMALAGFLVGTKLERSAGGALSAEQVCGSEEGQRSVHDEAHARRGHTA